MQKSKWKKYLITIHILQLSEPFIKSVPIFIEVKFTKGGAQTRDLALLACARIPLSYKLMVKPFILFHFILINNLRSTKFEFFQSNELVDQATLRIILSKEIFMSLLSIHFKFKSQLITNNIDYEFL